MENNMPSGHAFRLIPPLLLAAISLVASPTPAQTFGPTVNVSKTKSDSGSQRMAVAGSNVYVVWVDDQGSYRPMFSRSTNYGQTFSTAVQIFSGNGTVSPHIAATDTNKVYIARSARPSPKSPSQVYFMRSTDRGATFGSQNQVSKASVDGAFFNALAVGGSNVYIVWHQWVGKWEVFLARSDNEGTTFKDPVRLSNTSTGNPLGVVKLVADATGGVHVAWSEDFGGGKSAIYYTRSMDGGQTFGGVPIEMSNNDTSTNVFPALALSGSFVYLAWMEHAACAHFSCQPGEAELHIFFRRSDNNGVVFLDVEDLTAEGGAPQLAVSRFGVHVIWHANPDADGNYDVFYTRSIDGGVFDPPSSISGVRRATGWETGVIAANGENVYISWSSAGEIYLARSADGGGSFVSGINVSNTASGDSGGPQLVATPTEVHVTWGDHTPGNWDVFYQRGTIP
jgi:hypothetical protein